MEEYKVSLGLAIGNQENWYHDNKNKSHVQLHMLFPPKAKEENYIKSDEYQRKRSNCFPSDDYIMKERDEDGGSRKKLKLSEDQTTLLEETFQDHNTLNTIEKHELADKLKLKPRQVEVWFQNRRARDKLKQTEREFQQLKRWCETLSEENQMLKKELHELTRKQIIEQLTN